MKRAWSEVGSRLVAAVVLTAAGCSGRLAGDGDSADGGGGGGGGGGDGGADGAPLEPVVVCAGGGDHRTIQDGIDAARPGQTVEVCAGRYREHLVIEKAVVVVGASGSEDTVLDAEGSGTGVVVRGADGGVTLRGLTIRDGLGGSRGGGVRCSASALALDEVAVVSSQAGSGGALSADGCALAIAGSRFADNEVAGSGGALYLERSTGEVSGSEIANNRAGDGGGVFQKEGSVVLRGNHIHDNQAVDGGGGVWNESDAPVTDNRIADNRAGMRGGGLSLIEHAAVAAGNTVSGNRSGDDGAGVFVFLSQASLIDNDVHDNHAEGDAGGLRVLGSQATIAGNRVHDNAALGDGGGMKISHDESVVHDNSFVGNTAGGLGGGIELDDDHSTLSRLVITHNRAWGGGGLHCNVVGVAFRVESTLIADNTATGSGGAVRYDGVTATGTFAFVTMANNASPGVGGADFTDGDARVENSIIAGNDGEQVRFEGGEAVGWRYGDISPDELAGMSDPVGANGNISIGPAFVDPGHGDYHLRSDSPCRNAGDPALADRDGSRADMGAYGGPAAP